MDAKEVAAVVAAVMAAMQDTPSDGVTVVQESADERATRKARPSTSKAPKRTTTNGPRASAARAPKSAPETWTVRAAWKGQEPTSGLLWAARKCGVTPTTIAKADKYALSCAIAAKRGLTVTEVA